MGSKRPAPGSGSGGASRKRSQKEKKLSLVLEVNTKWRLLGELVEEIRTSHADQARQPQQPPAAAAGVDADLDADLDADAGLGAGAAPAPPPPDAGARVLIMVADEKTRVQVEEFLTLGGDVMIRRSFLRFMAQGKWSGSVLISSIVLPGLLPTNFQPLPTAPSVSCSYLG